MRKEEIPAKVIEKINARAKKEGECLIWKHTYKHNNRGQRYPLIWINGKRYHTHRVVHLLNTGHDPKGKRVYRTCNNTMCVNPKHIHVTE